MSPGSRGSHLSTAWREKGRRLRSASRRKRGDVFTCHLGKSWPDAIPPQKKKKKKIHDVLRQRQEGEKEGKKGGKDGEPPGVWRVSAGSVRSVYDVEGRKERGKGHLRLLLP